MPHKPPSSHPTTEQELLTPPKHDTERRKECCHRLYWPAKVSQSPQLSGALTHVLTQSRGSERRCVHTRAHTVSCTQGSYVSGWGQLSSFCLCLHEIYSSKARIFLRGVVLVQFSFYISISAAPALEMFRICLNILLTFSIMHLLKGKNLLFI